MLTKRQTSIFLDLCENAGNYCKANTFTEKYNVSLRTVQNDIKAIKDESEKEINCFTIESKVPFGTRINVLNKEKYLNYVSYLKSQNDEYSLSDKDDRIYKLLQFLLSQRKSISLTKCSDYIFVSKSTLANDLKELETAIKKYNLRLIQSKGYLWIDGLERDKIIFLMEN